MNVHRLASIVKSAWYWIIGYAGIVGIRESWWRSVLSHLNGPHSMSDRTQFMELMNSLPPEGMVFQVCDRSTTPDSTGSLLVGALRSPIEIVALWPKKLATDTSVGEHDSFAAWHANLLRLGLANSLRIEFVEDWPSVAANKSPSLKIGEARKLFLLGYEGGPRLRQIDRTAPLNAGARP